MSDEQKSKSLGATPHAGGVAFWVWAPHAQRVSVIGSFNDWNGDTHPMQGEENGSWYADVAEAHIGDQYRYLLTTATGECKRIDPYAREVTNSVGNAIVHDPRFDWEGDDFHLAPWNELVIYELHVGTFNVEEADTRQIIAFHVGDRSRQSGEALWGKIPMEYQSRPSSIRIVTESIRVLSHQRNTGPSLSWRARRLTSNASTARYGSGFPGWCVPRYRSRRNWPIYRSH